ncbi:sensor domain-containing protein [Brevibacillus daliensis]|uniref:sensor domain-containing protein n=1 Tax=Brevibacillus daliensis TaxID=2892995 RepID=UPI001E4F3EF5|nr:EAL domain-containing protein [Brevibacillus daliensis]
MSDSDIESPQKINSNERLQINNQHEIEITELKNRIIQLEQSIQETTSYQQRVLQCIQHHIIVVKRREDGQFIISLSEGKLTQLYKINSKNVTDKAFDQVLPRSVYREFQSKFEEAFLGTCTWFEFRLHKQVFFMQLSPIMDKEKVIEIVGTIIDITSSKQTEQILHILSQEISNKTGTTFFKELTHLLTDVLDIDCAYVAMLDRERDGRASTLAISSNGKIIDNIQYDIVNTPTEEVIKSGSSCTLHGAMNQFSLGYWEKNGKVEAQMGRLLFNSNGTSMGILGVMHSKPIGNQTLVDSMLNLFASRASTELERMLAEDQLIKNNAILKATQESIMDGILIVDEQHKIVHYNRKCKEIWNIPEQIENQKNAEDWLTYMVSQVDKAGEHVEIFGVDQMQPITNEPVELNLHDGRVLEVFTDQILSRDQQSYGRIWVFKDMTERKKNEDLLRQHIFWDALTGLPNRTLFDDRLHLAISQAKRADNMLAVAVMDLDCFRVINDTLGVEAGDQLLRQVAKRMAEGMREGDTVCRLIGDEFQFIFPDISGLRDVATLAEQLHNKISMPFEINGEQLVVTCSIGISLYPTDGVTPLELVKNAKAAMYRSKERGGNNYQLYMPTMNQSTFLKLTLMQDLRNAIERGELFLQYQPRYNMNSDEIIGMEALVRWNHPKLGLIPPGDFIPLAEELGLISALDEYVLQEACKQNKAWQDAGFKPIRVSVNVSPVEFQQRNLAKMIAETLKETGLSSEYLEVEITEGVTMHQVEVALSTLYELKQLGIHISIDDFGTGYSSLSYLKKFPVDTLKIDRSFIRDIEEDDDVEIVSYIIALARSLKLNVIAEGVETEEQKRFLTDKNCFEMQGYYFSPPLNSEEFESLLIKK